MLNQARLFTPNRRRLSLALAIVAALASPALLLLGTQSPSPVTPAGTPDAGKLPLVFVPNIGQVEADTGYVAQFMGGFLQFKPTEVVVQLTAGGVSDAQQVTLGMSFQGNLPSVALVGDDALPGKVNYFTGDDPALWRTGVQTYNGLLYQGLYTGIDLQYEGGVVQPQSGAPILKGTYHVAPGADPSQISWKYTGAQGVALDQSGNLLITLNVATGNPQSALTELAPVAWQEVAGQRIPVEARYAVAANGAIGFSLGSYDPSRPLVIDPTLTYSTYLGGNFAENGESIAVDPAGNFYVTGYTNSTNFPRVNAFQNTYGGGATDAYVAKFNSEGQPVYLTYLGGSSSDWGNGITTDPDGNAYLLGYTASQNFPRVNAYQNTFGGGVYDAFIAKLNPSGSALVFSTYLGGSEDELGGDITVDATRNLYVTGSTDSDNFPLRNPIQPQRGFNSYDLFVTKMNPDASDLIWSTYLGGATSDNGDSIALDSMGNTFVAGFTYSDDYPTVNAFQSNLRGTRDAILSKINPAGSALVYSTYLGGGFDEIGKGVAVDPAGNAYLAGYTDSMTFPVINGYQSSLWGLSDAFVTKFSPTGTAIYSTYFGGEWLESADDIAVNSAGEAYIMGSTQSDQFPLANPIDSVIGGSEDIFVTRFNATGTGLIFSTYIGGNDNREMQGGGGSIALDAANTIYFTGDTEASDFPTVNPYQPFRGSAVDAFVSRISENPNTPTPTATGSPQPSPTTCVVGNYTVAQGTGTIVPATNYLPNSACDNCTAPIVFPFPIRFYDQVFTQGRVGSEGTLQFTGNNALQANFCLPYGGHNNTIFVFWDDLWVGDGGVRTLVTGTSPNRVLNLEWRGDLSINNEPVRFELRLFENGQQFETIYAETGGSTGSSATIGVQRDTGSLFTQYSCNQPVITPGLKLTWTMPACLTPTITPAVTTPTATASATATAPTLLYSTYFGSFERDIIEDVGKDAAGNIYVAGTTFQQDINYGSIFVAKFSPNGQQLLYHTIMDGARIDYGYALAVDAAGNATVAGLATSIDYPLVNPLQAQHNGGVYDTVITKLNPQGGTIFSTYLGGNNYEYAERLQTDAQGNIYMTGRTQSTNWPTTQGAFQPASRGQYDGYVTKINPTGSAIIWSTYLGGLFSDTANDLALDAEGNVYVTGHTVSPDFPTLNPFQPAIMDSSGDAFVTKLNSEGTGLIYSTFLGGSFPPGPGEDNGQGIVVDDAGHAYVTGFTESPNFPTTAGAFQQFFKGYSDAFVTKFTPAGNALVYSTFLGGTLAQPYGEDIGYDIAIDGANQVHITGKTYSPDFPIVNAVQPLRNDVYEAFVTKFNSTGSGLVYSTYLGGDYQPPSFTGNDTGLGILIDSAGNAVIVGGTGSYNFPVVNPFQGFSEGPGDGFIAKISGSNPVFTPTPFPTGQATSTRTATAMPSPTACGYAVPILEGFEGGTLGAFVATAVPTGMPGWRATQSASHSGGWSAHSPSTYTAGDQRLTTQNSSLIPAGVSAAQMQFWHRYLLEPGSDGLCTDGGVLEISADGGASWLDAAPYFTAGGYNGEINGWQNPLTGRQGWCGQSVIFSQVSLNLTSFAGQSLHFRFRQGTDTFIAHDGWWIDDVMVSYTGACTTGTVTPQATASQTRTAVAPSVTPQVTGTAAATSTGQAPTATGQVATATSVASQTSASASSTVVATAAASATVTSPSATSTPQTCAITFTDVPTDHTFYSSVMCLACRNILGGYSDGTFRPGNDITRGQLAKIVAGAAGYTEPVSGQRFTDVPSTHTFYEPIERMAARGIIGGYADGTFRPGNPATRGQIAKIVSNAAGYSEPVSGQRFTDVPPTHTFYEPIERIAGRGIIGGYSDGTFRPGNNATRGQTSKIVSNTFYPGCVAP